VTAGSYTVVETDPSGFVSTSPNSVSITVGAGGAASASFGDKTLFVGTPVLKATKASVLSTDLNGNAGPNPGDTLQYTIHITNIGTASATGVVFTDTPDRNTTLVVGSVQTSSGTVTGGNAAGNTAVGVAIGTLPSGVSVTISYRAVINDPFPTGITSISNQGTVTSAQLPPASTDDPNSAAIGDATKTIISANPTAISLASFTAVRQGDSIVVRWVTTAEINTWGFHLYRSADGKRTSAVRVTPALIPGQGRGQGGASYIWTDTAVDASLTYTYWLVESEISGATNEYGPATASVRPAGMTYRLFLPVSSR
jgi:uncharacterized repeat protein (TIGR01451 family)